MSHGHGHGIANGDNKKIAVVIAVLALFLSIAETLGKSAQTDALKYNVVQSLGLLPGQDYSQNHPRNGRLNSSSQERSLSGAGAGGLAMMSSLITDSLVAEFSA